MLEGNLVEDEHWSVVLPPVETPEPPREPRGSLRRDHEQNVCYGCPNPCSCPSMQLFEQQRDVRRALSTTPVEQRFATAHPPCDLVIRHRQIAKAMSGWWVALVRHAARKGAFGRAPVISRTQRGCARSQFGFDGNRRSDIDFGCPDGGATLEHDESSRDILLRRVIPDVQKAQSERLRVTAVLAHLEVGRGVVPLEPLAPPRRLLDVVELA